MKILKSLFVIIALFLTLAATHGKENKVEDLSGTAFIVIDIQNDYFKSGRKTLEGSEEASLKAKKLLDFFRKKGVLVVHVQHIAKSAKSTYFLPDTDGAKIHKDALPIAGEKIVTKSKVSSFEDTDLGEYLDSKNIKELILCGMQTNVCLEKAAMVATEKKYGVKVIEDAAAAVKKETHVETIDRMKKNGIKVLKTDEIIGSLE